MQETIFEQLWADQGSIPPAASEAAAVISAGLLRQFGATSDGRSQNVYRKDRSRPLHNGLL